MRRLIPIVAISALILVGIFLAIQRQAGPDPRSLPKAEPSFLNACSTPDSPDCEVGLSSNAMASENSSSGVVGSDHPSSGVQYCAALEEVTTIEECGLFVRIRDSLGEGRAAISAPSQMQLNEKATISLAIGRGSDPAHVEELLGTAPTKSVALRVARRMGAQLVGDGFQITPAGVVVQDLLAGGEQIWHWEVTAIEAPRHELILSAYAVVQVPGRPAANRLLTTMRQPIEVYVPWGHWARRTITDATDTLTTAKGFFVALLAMLTAAFGVWTFVKARARKRDAAAGTGADQVDSTALNP